MDRSIAGRNSAISDPAIRSTYGLTDDQIGRVHWLVQKQIDTLGAPSRNHAFYVKRAAEAVRDRNDALLDGMLSEVKQAAGEIGIGSRPAYFHAMYGEALEKHAIHALQEHGEAQQDARDRMIADAEGRGIVVPDYIRRADLSAVSHWWAALIERGVAA